jgi:hypothetical protein
VPRLAVASLTATTARPILKHDYEIEFQYMKPTRKSRPMYRMMTAKP